MVNSRYGFVRCNKRWYWQPSRSLRRACMSSSCPQMHLYDHWLIGWPTCAGVDAHRQPFLRRYRRLSPRCSQVEQQYFFLTLEVSLAKFRERQQLISIQNLLALSCTTSKSNFCQSLRAARKIFMWMICWKMKCSILHPNRCCCYSTTQLPESDFTDIKCWQKNFSQIKQLLAEKEEVTH